MMSAEVADRLTGVQAENRTVERTTTKKGETISITGLNLEEAADRTVWRIYGARRVSFLVYD